LTAHTLRVLALLLAIVVLAGRPAVASASERSAQEHRAGPLVVRYVGAEDTSGKAEFAWYASAVEQAYQDVQDVFDVALRETGTKPRDEIIVTLYGDDSAYARANPVAAREEGVLGHAHPSEGVIGVAVARLRDKSEGFRRDALRHELTHVVLGDLSSQRLPIGFQEGVAQYLERDIDQRQRFATAIRRGREGGQLLSLTDLNRQRPFLSAAGLAYPQSYSLVAYLAERYGFGKVIHLVTTVRDVSTLDEAVRRVFERSLSEIEAEWQAFLPGYLDHGWARNDLDLWSLAEPRRLLGEGKYAEARDTYDRADALFTSMSRPDRLETVRAERQRAVSGLEAIDFTHRGTAALSAGQYDGAADLLIQGERRWTELGESRRAALAALAATQARDGQSAVLQLAEARRQLESWHFQLADDLAYDAGQVLAELGDEARTEEARQVMRDAQQLRTRLGLAAAGGGVAGVGLLGVGWAASRRRRARPVLAPPAVAVMERDWSL
jgi:tetratricopeptide (TPR) repeat protein